MRTIVALILAMALVLAGCDQPAPPPPDVSGLAPVPVLQKRAYPETITGRFVSLADFEDAPGGQAGFAQAQAFSLAHAQPGERLGPAALSRGELAFTLSPSATGAGALRAVLPRQAALRYTLPGFRDVRGYALLSLAVYTEAPRDDLAITLVSGPNRWQSPRKLIQPGWNTVAVDIRPLAEARQFDARQLEAVELHFARAAGPVGIVVDDLLLIDNRRRVAPSPPQVGLSVVGLDYELSLPGSPPIALRPGRDGLWRLNRAGIGIELLVDGAADRSGAAGGGRDAGTPGRARIPGEAGAGGAGGDPLAVMGERRIGRVRLVEANPVRLRLINEWFFPSREGEWVSMGVRRIRWEHTLYAGGRWVTHLRLNNAGGRAIRGLRLGSDWPAMWPDHSTGDVWQTELDGVVGRWSLARPVEPGAWPGQWAQPGRLVASVGGVTPFAPGDLDRDGYDESRGCYVFHPEGGQARFELVPPAGGLVSPVISLPGPWGPGGAVASSEGLALPAHRAGGGAGARAGDDPGAKAPAGETELLVVCPGRVDRPIVVEIRARSLLATPAGDGREAPRHAGSGGQVGGEVGARVPGRLSSFGGSAGKSPAARTGSGRGR